MAIDYRDKIKKLLALAESTNENEAKAALLKARQLMAEHKLREADCIDAGKLTVRKENLRDISCTGRKNSWMVPLSAVIAEHYCCQAFSTRERGKQRRHVGFIGIEDDFMICTTVFRYAVDCILNECKALEAKYKGHYPTNHVRRICDAYGFGFTEALSDMYDRQDEENEQYGIILVVPQAVTEATIGMKPPTSFGELKKPETYAEVKARTQGYADGEEFDPEKRIGNGEEESNDERADQ